jgi:hypothetical protein
MLQAERCRLGTPKCKYRENRSELVSRARYNLWQRREIYMAGEEERIRDERSPELKGDLEAQPDELGNDPAEVGMNSAGQSASSLGLDTEPEATEDSVEDLADTDQAIEAAAVEGVEDAANHPERPTHTHEEYGRPDDVPPRDRKDEAA